MPKFNFGDRVRLTDEVLKVNGPTFCKTYINSIFTLAAFNERIMEWRLKETSFTIRENQIELVKEVEEVE